MTGQTNHDAKAVRNHTSEGVRPDVVVKRSIVVEDRRVKGGWGSVELPPSWSIQVGCGASNSSSENEDVERMAETPRVEKRWTLRISRVKFDGTSYRVTEQSGLDRAYGRAALTGDGLIGVCDGGGSLAGRADLLACHQHSAITSHFSPDISCQAGLHQLQAPCINPPVLLQHARHTCSTKLIMLDCRLRVTKAPIHSHIARLQVWRTATERQPAVREHMEAPTCMFLKGRSSSRSTSGMPLT